MIPRTSIFIVSFAKDQDWLNYLFKSLARFATGFHEIVIAVPEHDRAAFEGMGLTREKLVYFYETIDGFFNHMVIKCSADLYCAGDFIVHIDSDCILTKPTTPETFFRDGKPLHLMTPYAALNGGSPWGPCTSKVIGRHVEYEFMRVIGNCYPRTMYAALRDHFYQVHRKSILEYLRGKDRWKTPPEDYFSDFNVLGAFGYYYRNGEFHWIDTSKESAPDNHIYQNWSHYRAAHPKAQESFMKYLS